MGGGAAMRAAAKAAASGGLGLSNAGGTLRGGIPEYLNAARKVIRHSTSSLSSSTASVEASAASHTSPAVAWEHDEWEFDGYVVEEELPPPRIVFGPAPSLHETTEATTHLRDALDMMYFSPSNSPGSFGSFSAVDERSVVSKSETLLTDTKTCVVNQNCALTSVPNQALQAFKLLRENPAAQTVVASIAADPNVWNAVLENDALKEYLQSEKKYMTSEEEKPLKSSEDSLDDQDAVNSENVFTNVFENIKLSVAGWVNNLSGFFKDWFAGSDVKTTSGPDNSSSSSTLVGGSLFGLAVMVIMVVIMKRG